MRRTNNLTSPTPSVAAEPASGERATPIELMDALDRMDQLLNPRNNLLNVPYESGTLQGALHDMGLIRQMVTRCGWPGTPSTPDRSARGGVTVAWIDPPVVAHPLQSTGVVAHETLKVSDKTNTSKEPVNKPSISEHGGGERG